jgi:NAD(P)-dependent dehydrogenase (short-subunit alcohol dehydrogenase family)
MKLDVAGRVALVTGARQGIGQAVTRALAARGVTVAAVDLAECADGAFTVVADVTDRAAIPSVPVHTVIGVSSATSGSWRGSRTSASSR